MVLCSLFQDYYPSDPSRFQRHRSLPPSSSSSSATLPPNIGRGGRGGRRLRLTPGPEDSMSEEQEDIYESIYDSRWRMLQKVRGREESFFLGGISVF